MYKTKLTELLYWSIIQHHSISKIVLRIVSPFKTDNRMLCCIYLQSIANGDFDFLKNSIGCKNTARDVLDEADEI